MCVYHTFTLHTNEKIIINKRVELITNQKNERKSNVLRGKKRETEHLEQERSRTQTRISIKEKINRFLSKP